MFRLAVLALFALSTSACFTSFASVKGSGQIFEEARVVAGFHSLDVGGGAVVLLTQGEADLLSIECDDNLLPHIRSEVINGVLHLGFKRGSYRPTEKAIYRVQMREIRELELSGSVHLECPSIQSPELSIRRSGSGSAQLGEVSADIVHFQCSGSGKMAVEDITVGDLTYRVSGSGNLNVASGTAGNVSLSTSGSSRVDISGVQAQTATVKTSGSGKAKVWVDGQLEVRISGSGLVQYRGEPRVKSKVSGSGSIEPLP